MTKYIFSFFLICTIYSVSHCSLAPSLTKGTVDLDFTDSKGNHHTLQGNALGIGADPKIVFFPKTKSFIFDTKEPAKAEIPSDYLLSMVFSWKQNKLNKNYEDKTLEALRTFLLQFTSHPINTLDLKNIILISTFACLIRDTNNGKIADQSQFDREWENSLKALGGKIK